MSKVLKIQEKTKIWKYNGETASWHFLTVSKTNSSIIREFTKNNKRNGFGSIKVKAKIGKTEWKTSIFRDRGGVYLLPLKKDVRSREELFDGDTVLVYLQTTN